MTAHRDWTAIGDTVTGVLIVVATAMMPRLSVLWAVTGGLYIIVNNAPAAWDYLRGREGNSDKPRGDSTE